MAPTHETVAVVVDGCFGNRLKELAARAHTWICTSEANRLAAQKVWTAGDSQGVTLFTAAHRNNSEALFLSEFFEIAEHHPDWFTMEVFGVLWTTRVAQRFSETGINITQLQERSDGFMVTRGPEITEPQAL